LVGALSGIDDETINVFLLCSKIISHRHQLGAYPTIRIDEHTFQTYNFSKYCDREGTAVLVNDLIQRRLLAPDTNAGALAEAGGGDWSVGFGLSDTSRKYAFAFNKAQSMLDALGDFQTK
jgi:hypothetical protein